MSKEDNKELISVRSRRSSSSSRMSEEQQIDVGGALRSRQTEWSELLHYDDITVFDMPNNNIQDVKMRCELAALYYKDAVNGRHVEFPQSYLEIQCYRISVSSRFLVFYGIVTFLNLILPFFTRPYCAWTSRGYREDPEYYESSDPSLYLDNNTVFYIKIGCLLVYYFEASIRFITGFSVRHIKGYAGGDKWLRFRVFVCVLLTVEYVVFGSRAGVFAVSQACVPFLYISRRHSLRQIVEGVGFAAIRCVDVLMLLLFLILLWSFVGYMIFNGIAVNQDGETYSKFDNFSESFYMCLQTFTTRTFLLFVLKPYYEVNPLSTLFFVSLTIVTDLLCTALIIATGNRQYRVHANNVFDRKLKSRKQAVVAAFQLLCTYPEENQAPSFDSLKKCYLPRDRWVLFCKSIPSTPVKLTLAKIHMIFNLEVDMINNNAINLESFFKLCAVLNSKYFIGLSEETMRAIEMQQKYEELMNSEHYDVLQEKFVNNKRNSNLEIKSKSAECNLERPQDNRRRRSKRSSATNAAIKSLQIREQLMRDQMQLTERRSSDDTIAEESLSSSIPEKSLREDIEHVMKMIQVVLRVLLDYRVKFTTYFGKTRINVFDSIVICMRLMLIVTQLKIVQDDAQQGWYIFWWCLEMYFWGEMIFLLLACGWKTYIKERGMGIPIVVNIMSLTLMCLTEDRQDRASKLFILTMLTQCVRLPSLVMQYKAASAFTSIIPLVFRVIFIVAAVIYFFRLVQ